MIKLYLDEDVPEAIAVALRLRGYNVITVREAARKGLADIDQLGYATKEGRVLFTHNIADFSKIHSDFIQKKKSHNGIILSRQLQVGVIIKALLKLLGNISPEKVKDQVIWLSDWIS